MSMDKRIRTRSHIIKHELQQRFLQEKTLIGVFIVALTYSLISNIVSRCCPIECTAELTNIGNAIDELFRNICYGVLAGVIFYVINDIYKNVVRRIPEMDKMFCELLELQVHSWSFLEKISHNNYDRRMDREHTFQCIMKNLCNEDVEFPCIGGVFKMRTIKVEDCVVLVNDWREAIRKQRVFLETYGDLLDRNEKQILNNFYDNFVGDIISYLNIEIENADGECIQVSEHHITIIVNRIIGLKIYLTDLAKKYIQYNYSMLIYLNRLCVEEDFS